MNHWRHPPSPHPITHHYTTNTLHTSIIPHITSVILYIPHHTPYTTSHYQAVFCSGWDRRSLCPRLGTRPQDTIQYYTILYNTIQYYTILYNTIQYYAILYNTIQYYTIPYNTIQDAPGHMNALSGRRRGQPGTYRQSAHFPKDSTRQTKTRKNLTFIPDPAKPTSKKLAWKL